MPHTSNVQTPGRARPPAAVRPPATDVRIRAARLFAIAERAGWVSALVLSVSAFTGWYTGHASGGIPPTAVIGWHTGVLGKLVFFAGLVVLALHALRLVGLELPPSVPESLVVVGIGLLATTFVLVRLISIPEPFVDAGRGIGIWISLAAGLALLVAGVLRAGEEL